MTHIHGGARTWSSGGRGGGLGFSVSQVVARPVRDTARRMMDDRHYPGFRGMFGDGPRHVRRDRTAGGRHSRGLQGRCP